MIIRLNSLISILLTTMLVFNYAIGNIVYATESADGANQSSTQNQEQQEQTTTEEEEQSTENSQENENSVVEEPQEEQSTEEQQTSPTEEEQATTEEQQTSPTEEDQATAEEPQEGTTEPTETESAEENQSTTQEEENNETEEQTTEESQEETTETAEEESTEGENEDQQESTDTDENSNTSISTESFLSTSSSEDGNLEYSLRNASGTTSDEVVADSNYFYVASIDGPEWTGGFVNKDDRHDVVRVFTFFDKSKVSVAGYYTHDGEGDPTVDKTKTSKLNPRGEPNSSGDYIYGGSLNTNASDDNAYAEEVGSVDYGRNSPATRSAQTYDTDADGGEYHGKPLYYIQSLDITSATDGRNPCKDVYDEAIATTGGFTSLRAATASDLGCVGFERFRGYDEAGGDFFAPSLGNNYPSNSDLHGLELKIKSGTSNGDTDLISVATSDGYNVSGTTTEPPITETVKTLTVVDNVFKIKTIDVINSMDAGETGTFNVGVEFLSTVSGFRQTPLDFRFVENGTTTKVGDVTRIRLLDPFYLDVPYDGIDTNRGASQYGQLLGRYFVVTVVPGQGLSGNYQFEIHPDTDIDTYVGDSKYNPTDVDTYKLSVSVFSTFLFSDLKISDSTVTSSFEYKDYTLAGNLKKREFFSRSNQIDVEFIANSNNGGGHPLPADFALKESASFDPNDPPTDCSNNTPTFSNITPDTSTTNLYSMTITLPTGEYNCRLSYSQTISGTKTEKTQPIVFDGAQYTANVLAPHSFGTFYINTEPREVSFNPLPATDVKTNSRSHEDITSTSAFDDLNYFNSSIGANVDVYDEVIDQATDCDASLSWGTKTKTDDDFTTDNENQNGKYICVRVYDDFVTNNLSADSLYSYDKLLVENIDTTEPEFTTVTIASNNTNTGFAKQGNIIKLTATANETLGGVPTFTTDGFKIDGNPITNPTFADDGDSSTTNTYQATYTVESGKSGAVSFSFTGTDSAGNPSDSTIATTNSSSVNVDSVAPSFTTVTIASNNSNPSLAKEGDTITLTATADGALNGVPSFAATDGFKIGNNTAIASIFADDGDTSTINTFKATYIVKSGDSGDVSFSFTASDAIGNVSDAVISTTDNSSINVDAAATEFTTVTIASSNSNPSLAKEGDTIKLTVKANKALNGVPTFAATDGFKIGTNAVTLPTFADDGDSSTTNTYTATYTVASGDTGDVSFSFTGTDPAGNTSAVINATTNSSTVIVDTGTPSFTTVTITSNNTNTSLAKTGDIITLTATSNETLSGVPTFAATDGFKIGTNAVTLPTFRDDGDSSTTNTYTATYTVASGDTGDVSFSFTASDPSGNTSSAVIATTDSSSVKVDGVAPSFTTVTITSNNTNDTSLAKQGDIITVTAAASTTLNAVPTFTSFQIGSNTVTLPTFADDGDTNTTNTYTATYTVASGDTGDVSFSFASTDEAGNTTTITDTNTTDSSSVRVDNDPPSFTTVKIYSNNTNNEVAKEGDTITIDIIANESLGAIPTFTSFQIGTESITPLPTFIINTNTLNTYRATYQVTDGKNGPVSFSLTAADQASNSVTITDTDITDSSSVTVNTLDLNFRLVQVSSNNTNDTGLAKQGDIITLTAEANAVLNGVPTFSSFTIGGTSVGTLPTFADDGDTNTTNTYIATYTVTSTDNGLVGFSFTGTNLTGVVSAAITTTTNSSSVIADTTNPEIPTETTPISTPTNDDTPTVVVNVKEDGTLVFGGDCKDYAPDDTSVTTGDNSITFKDMLDATYTTCTIKLNDSAGNESTALTLSDFTINTSITDIPTITTPIPTQTNDKTPTIEVSVTSDGTLVFGGSCKDYAPDDTSVTSGTNSITFKLIPDGTYTDCSILLRSTAGTDSASVTLPSFTIDAAKPTFSSVLLTSTDTTNDPYAKQGETITLTVTANETLTSSPTFSSFAIGGTNVTLPTFADDGDTNTTNTYIATYTVQSGENGVISFSFTGTDLVSNTSDAVTSTTNSSAVNVDTTNPKTDTISVDTSNPQPSILNVNVTFSESVENVTTSNFGFFNTSAVSFGAVESVTVYDSSFTNSTNSTTDTTTSLAGRYFKVLIKLNEDIDDTYTFKVLAGSIVDDATNTFETSSNDSLSVAVDTERKPTLTSVSDADPSTTLKTGDFKINVEFSEVVYSVNKNDFQFTDGSASVGTITQVEAVDFDFDSKNPKVITTNTTTISGRYFIVSVDPDEGLLTESAVTYTFEVLSSEGITDGVPKSFDGTDGATTTLDITIDTLDPQIISSEIVSDKLVLTSSLSLGTASVTGDNVGGFTVYGAGETTSYNIAGVDVSGKTITITFTSGTAPRERGTYEYKFTTNPDIEIKTLSDNALDSIAEGTIYGPPFTIDFDGSGDSLAASDAFFLYLYAQDEDGGVDITDGVLGQAIFGGVNNVLATKKRIYELEALGYLDFDQSGDFYAASDAFFLYLYRQNQDGGVDITDGVLGQAIFGGVNNVLATKTRIDNYIQGIQNP